MKFIKINEVMNKTGLGRSTIYFLIKKGLFPKQLKVSERASCWLENEISSWMEEKVKNRLH